MDFKAKYDEIMQRAGEEWSEHVYFILSHAVRTHATNNYDFMQFYLVGFEKCKDEELKKDVRELKEQLEAEYRKISWFVEPSHHYW